MPLSLRRQKVFIGRLLFGELCNYLCADEPKNCLLNVKFSRIVVLNVNEEWMPNGRNILQMT